MPEIIISDTSCFIILNKIGKLSLLKAIYGKITTTKDIAEEFGEQLPDWVEIKEVKDKYRQQLLEMQIDKGESSAITLVYFLLFHVSLAISRFMRNRDA